MGPYEGGHIADGGRHVKYSSQLSGRNNPRKEAEFSGSGGGRGDDAADADTRGAQVLTHTPVLPELCFYYSGLNFFGNSTGVLNTTNLLGYSAKF